MRRLLCPDSDPDPLGRWVPAARSQRESPLLADTILEGLNPEQRAAVETTEGPLLVLAGAGSGKTRVLTSRVAYLIGVCGIPAESILGVTFTNKAAGEMRERVEKLLGPSTGGLWLSTFHSMCVRILRRDIGALQRSRGFVIYDDADSLGVSKQVLKRHDLDPRQYDPKRLRWRIDEWKNQGLLPAAAAARARDIDDELTARLYATYQRLLFDANALDFGDLLLQTVELFRHAPQVLGYYQRRWQYVLVDEYQDTNRVQYDLVRMLAGAHENLCVVGDPDQSVYAWRGADIRNILDFEQRLPAREGHQARAQLSLDPAHPLRGHRRRREQPRPQEEEHVHRAEGRRAHPLLRGGGRARRGGLRRRPHPARYAQRRPVPGRLRDPVSHERPVAGLRGGAPQVRPGLHGGRRGSLLRAGRDQGSSSATCGCSSIRRTPRHCAASSTVRPGASARRPWTGPRRSPPGTRFPCARGCASSPSKARRSEPRARSASSWTSCTISGAWRTAPWTRSCPRCSSAAGT